MPRQQQQQRRIPGSARGSGGLPPPPRQQQQQQRPVAELAARDANLQLQRGLARRVARTERDRQAWRRGSERLERDLLIDLAHILDCRLTPSIDEWCSRRQVRQASQQPDDQHLKGYLTKGDKTVQNSGGSSGHPAAAAAAASAAGAPPALDSVERQRILEAKRRDWLGFTSVPLRPMTAVAAAQRPAAAADPTTEEQRSPPTSSSRPAGRRRPKSAAAAAATRTSDHGATGRKGAGLTTGA